MSIHLTKCHIVENHTVAGQIYDLCTCNKILDFLAYLLFQLAKFLGRGVPPPLDPRIYIKYGCR